MTEERYERSWETFGSIDCGVGEQVLKGLEAIAPDIVCLKNAIKMVKID